MISIRGKRSFKLSKSVNSVRVNRQKRELVSNRTSRVSPLEQQSSNCNTVHVERIPRDNLQSSKINTPRRISNATNVIRVTRIERKSKRKNRSTTNSLVDKNSFDLLHQQNNSFPNQSSPNEPTAVLHDDFFDDVFQSVSEINENNNLAQESDSLPRFSSISSKFPIYKQSNKKSSEKRRASIDQIRNLAYEKKRKNKKLACRPIVIATLLAVVCLLFAGILATTLALTLRNTNAQTTNNAAITTIVTTTITTTTNVICTAAGLGTLMSVNDSTPSTTTLYTLSFTATNTSHTLNFGFRNENNREYYLDSVSVQAVSAPGVELLTNGDFENSSALATGWSQSCTHSCGASPPGNVTNSGNCASGNCFIDGCEASSGIDFLAQTFLTTIGQSYTVSFQLFLGGGGTTSANAFFVDIF